MSNNLSCGVRVSFFFPPDLRLYQALEQGKLRKTETALLYEILCHVEEQGFPSTGSVLLP